jgi:hypothetical protein
MSAVLARSVGWFSRLARVAVIGVVFILPINGEKPETASAAVSVVGERSREHRRSIVVGRAPRTDASDRRLVQGRWATAAIELLPTRGST